LDLDIVAGIDTKALIVSVAVAVTFVVAVIAVSVPFDMFVVIVLEIVVDVLIVIVVAIVPSVTNRPDVVAAFVAVVVVFNLLNYAKVFSVIHLTNLLQRISA